MTGAAIPENAPEGTALEARSKRGPGGRQPGAGRKPTHGLAAMRRTLSQLTTKRLDGRSAVAVAVRTWKADVRRDLGGDLTRAQETLLEMAAQTWVLVSTCDDYIARQPSIVTKKRQLLPVVVQRQQLVEQLSRTLDRLGLQRKAKDADVDKILAGIRNAPHNPQNPGGASA